VKNLQNAYKGIDYTTYIVKPGDSLYAIAQLFDSSVEMIKNVNNLGTNTIYPNQILFIPKRMHSNNRLYQTVEGDTLSTVFRKLNLDPKCLKNYAPMMDVLLVPNQVIELVGKTCSKEKNIIYMGEDIEEFLMNNEIDAMDLIKTNKWLTPGARVRIG
jgi:LysM repeat protein